MKKDPASSQLTGSFCFDLCSNRNRRLTLVGIRKPASESFQERWALQTKRSPHRICIWNSSRLKLDRHLHDLAFVDHFTRLHWFQRHDRTTSTLVSNELLDRLLHYRNRQAASVTRINWNYWSRVTAFLLDIHRSTRIGVTKIDVVTTCNRSPTFQR